MRVGPDTSNTTNQMDVTTTCEHDTSILSPDDRNLNSNLSASILTEPAGDSCHSNSKVAQQKVHS